MKSIQIGNSKIKIIVFETLQEISVVFTEKEMLTILNKAYQEKTFKPLTEKENRN